MCTQTTLNEKRVLTLSALVSSVFAGGGLVIGLLVGSLVIAFDGVYSSVSMLLTLLSLAVAKYLEKPQDTRFPFGRALFEPLVITFKGLVILMVVAYSLYSAVIDLLAGGHAIDTSIATLFGLINVVGCGITWYTIARMNRKYPSGLIGAEIKQWQMDTLLSVVITVAFIIAWVMTLTPLAPYAVYVDPMLMLLMSFYFIKVPVMMIKSATREMLLMAPDKEICQRVDQGILAANEMSTQELELAAVTKIGRELWVDIDIIADKNDQIDMQDIEATRQTLEQRLSKLPFELQLTLNVA
ncbi:MULTISPECIES: cation diffusion facilitator family transporter [Vibrio]|uniref:Cation diffusion facilitator family transporter n=2 Tax=Vibrio TaxID=662 RepID=A0A7X4LJ51_9VIBR|nr:MULTISPECIES: cation diffusion facilitator family transporter [Vibrio]MBF9002836.1 cation diffusion facilitator family transporter [Vibrio nitrifigilis]MZI92943.1 cation diffusion facilitator family transporter [Vibrio eleionomae]